MLNDVLISDTELLDYSKDQSLAERTRGLVLHQKQNWDIASAGYKSLDTIEFRAFEFDGFIIKIQFNPGRIISSSAKVDDQSIRERKCFLCYNNLPESQKGIKYYRDYLILVNPFPIFPEHLTMPKIDHVPQQILNNFEGLLNLSKDIGKYYTVFYNGPKCGASAPDHMHFQAGLRDYMPVDYEYNDLIKYKSELLFEKDHTVVYGVSNYLRRFFSIEGKDKKGILKTFGKIYNVLELIKKEDHEEPMLNIISYYADTGWKVLIFPRSKHRPSYYFNAGDRNILLSPAAVDLGGICITPQEKDFNKITKDQVVDVFRQVSISTEIYEYFKKCIKEQFDQTD